MAKTPWITIIGLGEDGPDGLPPASQSAIEAADVIMGAARHLDVMGQTAGEQITWPVPFSHGIAALKGLHGRKVAVLASGDPFWFGAGGVIAREFPADAWRCLPAPSVFSHAAAQLGWKLEQTLCTGLHAKPIAQLRPLLSPGVRILTTLRDGNAVSELARYLADQGFGGSNLAVMQALGGPRAQVAHVSVAEAMKGGFEHPVCVGISVCGRGESVPLSSGIPDALFETDGVMTKRPVRALTMSALAPRRGERLWDIGGGSGSIAIEWLLADPSTQAVCIEPRADRVKMISTNAAQLGVDRLQIITGSAPDALGDLDMPDAVFIGGGLNAGMIAALEGLLEPHVRIAANAVTLEAEALLNKLHQSKGGELIRVEVSQIKALGSKRGWQAAYPIVQWSGHL